MYWNFFKKKHEVKTSKKVIFDCSKHCLKVGDYLYTCHETIYEDRKFCPIFHILDPYDCYFSSRDNTQHYREGNKCLCLELEEIGSKYEIVNMKDVIQDYVKDFNERFLKIEKKVYSSNTDWPDSSKHNITVLNKLQAGDTSYLKLAYSDAFGVKTIEKDLIVRMSIDIYFEYFAHPQLTNVIELD